MDKPTVHIETMIAGHLTSRLPNDVTVARQMLATRDGWARARPYFDCYTSEVVRYEAGQGDPDAAAGRLQVLAGLPLLPIPPEVDAVADLELPPLGKRDPAGKDRASASGLWRRATDHLHARGTIGATAMMDDPIVDEVHRVREQMLAESDGDLTALIQDMRRRTDEAAKAGQIVVSRSPRPAQQPWSETRKVG